MADDGRPEDGQPDDGRPGSAIGPTPEHLEQAAATLALLSAPTRLHLMWLLCHGEQDVTALAEAVGGTVPGVSQHLAKLRLAGLVRARREGRHQVYCVDDPHVLVLVEQIFEHTAPEGLVPDRDDPSRPRRRGLRLPLPGRR